jgi:cytochrome o ubiquinol oxidase subunit 1
MAIAVPTGVKIFNWLFTMYRGRIRFTTPMLWFLAFVFTFTLGGMAGVLMAVPPIDFQVHNSLFLVAHFHTMIVGGVLFGYFAGLTYWFPKIFGFRLNERLGRYAVWCWLSGFLLAFGPLYILGLMGATRRMDHYDPSLGWQQLFIVAGVGVALIAAGVGFQLLQLAVSIKQRNENRDITGDPWKGRTLEWATSSPAPVYNFARTPEVTGRDAFWTMKHSRKDDEPEGYKAITMPKNTPLGMVIAAFSLTGGFALIWHIYWLAAIGLLGVIATVIYRSTDENTEYTLSAAAVRKIEEGAGA